MLPQKIHKIVGYNDDSYLQGTGYDQCLGNVKDTVTLLNKLGLLIHPDKSVLYPTQQIVFLGFQVNSVTMSLHLQLKEHVRLRMLVLIYRITSPLPFERCSNLGFTHIQYARGHVWANTLGGGSEIFSFQYSLFLLAIFNIATFNIPIVMFPSVLSNFPLI